MDAPSLIGITVGILILVAIVSGAVAFAGTGTVTTTTCEIISRTASAAMLMTFSLGFVGRMREVFIGFGVELPGVTNLILRVTDWGFGASIIVGLVMTICVVTDGILFGMFHGNPNTQRMVRCCSLSLTMALFALPIAIAATLLIPMSRLLNDLA